MPQPERRDPEITDATAPSPVLITGASGTIGTRLVQGLLERGLRVRVLVLPGDPGRHQLEALGCAIYPGDITRPETLGAPLEGVHTVYHMAAVILSPDPAVFSRVNVEGTRNMTIAAQNAGVEHLIYVSSASVVYPRSTPYSRSKQAAEQIVEASDLPCTIARPTLVYEDDGGEEFLRFVDYLLRLPVVPLIGDGAARKNPVHVDDLVAGLLAIAGRRETHGQLYNLCGGQVVTMRELAELLLHHCGRPNKPIVPLPVALWKAVAIGMKLVLPDPPLTLQAIAGVTQDADLDRSSAARDLGYDPVGIDEGLRRLQPAPCGSPRSPRSRRGKQPHCSPSANGR